MLKRSFVATVTTATLATVCAAHAAILYVGPARQYRTLAAGVAAAQAGDTLMLDQGTYENQWATVTVPLTIVGMGTGAILAINEPISNGKGILVTDADVSVQNITFQGAQVTSADGNNGAGIRVETGNLSVSNCQFNGNQDGMLIDPVPSTSVTVNNSSFNGNGFGDGYTHAIYANGIAILTVTNSTFNGTKVGHDIKSRAYETVVKNTTLDDGVTGTTSYAVDLPNGGAASLSGLTIHQGTNTENPTMISYGEEGGLHPNGSLVVSDSTFTNTLPRGSIGVNNYTNVSAQLENNTFTGVQTPLQGPGQITSTAAALPSSGSSSGSSTGGSSSTATSSTGSALPTTPNPSHPMH